uniref:ADAM metallopeptidase with thrombospondin type 1 motif, 13 n=1 Tax=Nothobranchius kuhntae TaxID=321403 RepID=A0A1A8HSD3_NOTKU
MVSRGSHFVDGTRCESDSRSAFGTTAACLQGRCQLFGCDGVLHSGKVWDVCGVCDGDGSTCSLISDSYRGGQAKEYTTFLTLPVNATQVRIINKAPLFTHLAVLVGGQYIVSGAGSIAVNVTHPSLLDENHLEYRLYLTPDFLPEMEEVIVPGPLKQEIDMQIYRKYGKEYESPLPSEVVIYKDKPQNRAGNALASPTEAITTQQTTTPTPTPSVCGQLFLEESGTVDLQGVNRRCTVSIGRPLDEIIHVKILSSSLDCKKKEYVAFF